ncbi:hypothetical protein [Nocardiopsis synnemataformans]|uniref:hypothetical protein n=1 Tax=Nocardiopsis synnemataformans TaxID=61305 RepID=UPI003EB83352
MMSIPAGSARSAASCAGSRSSAKVPSASAVVCSTRSVSSRVRRTLSLPTDGFL